MNRHRVGWRSGVLTCALVALIAAPSAATVLLPGDFGEMVGESQTIVHGRVTGVQSIMIDGRRTIERVVTVEVLDALKGTPGRTVAFRTPGGQVGRYRRIMVGAPEFQPGDEVVLFLKGRPPELPRPYGLSQGVYRVARAADGRLVVTQPIPQPGLVAERVVRGDPARRPLPIDEFSTYVRTLKASAP
jgi:hypothetical protein